MILRTLGTVKEMATWKKETGGVKEGTRQLPERGRGMSPVVAGNDDVDASTGLADVGRRLIVHLPQRVCEGTSGVDDALGPHIKLLT